jgi:hypothetical protein
MRSRTLALAAAIVTTLVAGRDTSPAFARPTAVVASSARAPAARLAKGWNVAPRVHPRTIGPIDLANHRTARAAARIERAIRDYERALGRADRLNLGSRRQISDLRRDVLFLRGLLQGLRRDGSLDSRDIGMLDAAMQDVELRLEALGPRGFAAPVRMVKAR